MRQFGFVLVIVAVLTVILLSLPGVAAAQSMDTYGPDASSSSSAFPYFRRTTSSTSAAISTSSSSSSFSSVRSSASSSSSARFSSSSSVSSVMAPTLSDDPQVGVFLQSDRSEVMPGDDVRYWIRIRNLSNKPLPTWQIAFFFDRATMLIADAGGARGAGDHLVWNVPALSPNADWTETVVVHIYKNAQTGIMVRTYASMIWDGTISPACSENDLVIIKRPPVTGADDDLFGPVEDTSRFLTPMPTSGGFWASLLAFFSW